MSDSALSVQYWMFQYQAQSDIADHGYGTNCPPMTITLPTVSRDQWWATFRQSDLPIMIR
jgi:hypothetical protein